MARPKKDELLTGIVQGQMLAGQIYVLLFLRALAFGNMVAERAWVFAIESFFQGLRETRGLRVGDHHAEPGN
jgi:hypothetical protein